jgi:D-sedoheptulose 7-phosphate isomerase
MTTAAATSLVQAHFTASIAATGRFFARDAALVAEACRRMAERFAAGGTLYVAGAGRDASDAQHVSVEFVHPVIVGKRALPAVALTSDVGVLTAGTSADGFASALRVLARPADMLLTVSSARLEESITRAIAAATPRGLLAITVSPAKEVAGADLSFAVGDEPPFIAQEVSETLYHVLWELVHVFLEAREPQVTSFLPAGQTPVGDQELLSHVVASTGQKARDVIALRQAVLARDEATIARAAVAMAERIARGGRLLAFGNGGSATDAQDAAVDAMAPPLAGWRPVPSLALSTDMGVVTAIGNDVGFEHVFARQITALARPEDVAIAFSTSGASRNLRAGMAEARRRGLLTIAFTGGDGGALARSGVLDFNVTAPSEHLPRIQEAHATAWHALLTAVQEALP